MSDFDSVCPLPWGGDAMAYILAHVRAGILWVDPQGCVWRRGAAVRGQWREVAARRAESPGNKGYLRIKVWLPQEKRLVSVAAHRLVYEALVGPIPEGLELDHVDGNVTNNHPANLEAVTGLVNMRRSWAKEDRVRPWALARENGGTWRGRPLLSQEDRERACEMRRAGMIYREIAAALGISLTHAQRITEAA